MLQCYYWFRRQLVYSYLSHSFVYFFHDGGPYHMETSSLICRANPCTGFYMTGTSAMKVLVTHNNLILEHWYSTTEVLGKLAWRYFNISIWKICFRGNWAKSTFIYYRSNHWWCSIKKLSLKISQNWQENTCARVSFLFFNFIKKEALTSVLSCKFCKNFQKTCFMGNASRGLLLISYHLICVIYLILFPVSNYSFK